MKIEKSIIFVQKKKKKKRRKNENRYAKDKKLWKVRDCCHYTGEYSGAAHSICNLKYSVPKKFL